MNRIFVSGRIEFLGKHTDYCGGRSIVCAIDKGFYTEVEPNSTLKINLRNQDTNEVLTFPFNENLIIQENHWIKYPQTVVKRIAQNFKSEKLQGVNIKFRSDLPQAAGLSSSSALMIAVFLAISKVNNLEDFIEYKENISDKLELAEYLGCIENGQSYKNLIGDKGVGTFGGSQDHTAILCGKKSTLSQFGFSPVRLEKEITLSSDLCFVIASSGVVAEKTGSAKEKYNRLSLMVREIINKFDENLTLHQLVGKYGVDKLKKKLNNQDLINRLQQFYTENFEIIPQVSGFLENNEIEKIGNLIDLSHQNADKFLNNQMSETNFLQSSARKIGSLAASAFGAGFGGSVYALVRKSHSEKFLEEWQKLYLDDFPQYSQQSKFFITNANESII